MRNTRWLTIPVLSCLFIGLGAARPQDAADAKTEQALHIDIPAKLDGAHVAFNIDQLMLNGDMPISLGHLSLLANDLSALHIKGRVIAVFHTKAGHVTLNDKAYNAARHVTTGNPYKELVTDLMNKGVQVELCGATARAYGWGNADLLPGVQVNTDAMVRLAQLGQEGYVLIKE